VAEQMQQMTASHMAEQNALAVLADASEGIGSETSADVRNEDLGWYKVLRSQQHAPPLERIACISTLSQVVSPCSNSAIRSVRMHNADTEIAVE